MAQHDLATLPRWASNRIRTLEAELSGAQNALLAPSSDPGVGANTFVTYGVAAPLPLGRGLHIDFRDGLNRFSVHLDDGILHVRGVSDSDLGGLRISPQSANSLRVELA